MGRASREKAVDNAADSQDADGSAARADASETPGELSRAEQIFATDDEAAAPELAEVPQELSEVEQAVWGWVNDHCFNTPISRATEALNYLRQHAVPDLLNRIKEI